MWPRRRAPVLAGCPVCHRNVTLTSSATLAQHGTREQPCLGSGLRPSRSADLPAGIRPATRRPAERRDVALEALERLADLYLDGALSAEEFAVKKAELLARI